MDWYPPKRRSGEHSLTRREVLKATGISLGAATVGISGSRGVSAGEHSPPAYDDIEVVREAVWVETGTDTDGTGEPDRTHVDIARPVSAETLPAVLRADPYDLANRERTTDGRNGVVEFEDMDEELHVPEQSGERRRLTGTARMAVTPTEHLDRSYFYEQQLLPDGYGFVYASPIGTGLSTGCSTLGGEPEIRSIEAVIDWLNGRGRAYRTPVGEETESADWTDGTTGMIGGSYRGALANGVAATGVDGLETIVPLRSISNWYNYVRSNGAVITPGEEAESFGAPLTTLTATVTTRENGELCDSRIEEMTAQLDRKTGNYNDFWDERNYLTDVDEVTASTLMVHGMYDRNVRPRHCAEWLAAMREHDRTYKAWIHQGAHDDPREHENQKLAWVELVRRWFEYWLKGEDNGVMDRPDAVIETPDERLVGEPDWPSPRSEPTALRFEAAGGGPFGALGTTPGEGTESLVNDSTIRAKELVGEANTDHRLVYRTGQLEGPLRVSGTPRAEFELAVDARAALLSVAVVDYGPEEPTLVNRGWANPQNRDSLEESTAITPGEQFQISFPMEPLEHVFEEGHRIGVMVYSSDHTVTRRPPSSTELTLDLSGSALEFPVVGGASAFDAAVTGGDIEENRYGEEYDYEGELYEQQFGDEGPEAYNRQFEPREEGDTDETGEDESTDETGEDESTDETGEDESTDETGEDESTDETGGDESTDETGEETGDDDGTEGQTQETGGNETATETPTESTDDEGPGFTIPGTLAGLGGLGYVLKRRLTAENPDQSPDS